jgi:hypothetical protein
MDKKKILIGVGLIALVGGISYYFYNKSKNTDTGDTSGDSESTKSTSASQESAPAIETATATATDSSTGTGIKGLKGSDRRDFRKETRATCEEKYGSGKDYRQCKRRVKDGGVAFTGDFEGMINSQFMFSEFENGLDLDL